MEAFLKMGAIAKGAIGIYHWSPLGKGKAGFDLEGKPDEEVEISAEASASAGASFDGTYASDDCTKPKPGLHGEVKLGKLKTNLKVKVKLGPISFEPNIELALYDGFKLDF